MANQLWTQDSFVQGELSPYMYARAGVQQYYNAIKTGQNVLTYPQGAAGKRFGTLYCSTLTGFTAANQIFFQTFQYQNQCVYQLLFKPDKIDIFLEGILINTVTGTGLSAPDVYNLDSTILQNRFRVTGAGFRPMDLTRSANMVVNPIIAVNAEHTQFTVLNAMTAGQVLPIQFTITSGNLPITIPQVNLYLTYFVKVITTNTISIYASSSDAANGINAFTLTTIGTGTSNIVPLNTWTFSAVQFTNYPIYDFTGGYSNITFTPSAVSGAAITLTSSSAIFTTAMVGGAYIGGGGVGRITAFTDSAHVTLAVQQAFDSTSAIAGSLSLLAQPAWDDIHGWPQKCSSYQNRALFANTQSLPNGFWASSVNDYFDFNDTQTDDNNAISWFPTSDDIAYINFIVPYRSITVHTNSGVYSNPLFFESAITPTNFSLQLQDSTPANFVRPCAIDNQIIVLSGNDAHALYWSGINNAYTSSIISVMNEQVIRNPVDEAPYVDLKRAGSRYVFIINEVGSMAIYQTLLTESISGWTPAITEQSYGNSYFRQVASSPTGRAWFVTEREIAQAASAINITSFTSSTLTATASNFSITSPTAIQFTTSGSLPSSIPILVVGEYYWAIGVTANTFSVYATFADAQTNVNAFTFTSAGSSSHVVPWPLTAEFFLEELTFDTFLDCAVPYNGTATSTVSGLPQFNAQDIKMIGDGFGFEAQGNNSSVIFEAHGQPVQITQAFIGFPINMIIEPMPLTMSLGKNSNYLTRPKHIRNVNFMFNNTIGGTINGVPIALNTFNQANIGKPPVPQNGIFELGVMGAWNDFNNPTFTIMHNDPFNIELLGIFYDVDI